MPLPFRRPSPVLLVLYGCWAVGLGFAAVGVLVDGAIRFWWVGLVICAVSGIATQIVRWRSRHPQAGDWALTDGVTSGPDRRRLPVQFVRVWVVLVVVAAALELTTRTPYQRVMLAAILVVALIVGVATCRFFGVRRGPLPQRSRQKPQRVTSAAFVAPILGLMIGYAGRFAVVPDSGDRSSFWAGSAGFLAGMAVAYPVIWLYACRRLDRRDAGNRPA